jgi:hypothetical protein
MCAKLPSVVTAGTEWNLTAPQGYGVTALARVAQSISGAGLPPQV